MKLLDQLVARYNGIIEEGKTAHNEHSYLETKIYGKAELYKEVIELLHYNSKQFTYDYLYKLHEDFVDRLQTEELEEDILEYTGKKEACEEIMVMLMKDIKECEVITAEEVITINMLSDLLEIMSRMGYDESYRAGATDTIRALLRLLEGNCHESP